MGAEQSAVEVNLEDSSVVPGAKIVRTAPFDDLTDFDKFWTALIETLKNDYKKVPNFKDGAVVEKGENHFEVFTVCDLRESGGPTDHITRMVYRLDKERGVIHQESRGPIFDLLLSCGTTQVSRDPLRVEYSRQVVQGDLPRYGEGVAGTLSGLLSAALGRDCKAKDRQVSLENPNLNCAMSEPLDDFTDYDALFDKMLEVLKEQRHNPLKADARLTVKEEKATAEDTMIYALSVPYAAEKLRKLGFPVSPDLDVARARMYIRASKSPRVFLVQTHVMDGPLFDVHHYNLHTNPLRVEAFAIGATPPFGDESDKKVVEQCIVASLKRARS